VSSLVVPHEILRYSVDFAAYGTDGNRCYRIISGQSESLWMLCIALFSPFTFNVPLQSSLGEFELKILGETGISGSCLVDYRIAMFSDNSIYNAQRHLSCFHHSNKESG